MSYRTLRQSGDIVQRGSGYYTLEEAFDSNPAGSRTTCIFIKEGDREDFMATVEFKERLATKGFSIALIHPGEEKQTSDPDAGRWEISRPGDYFYGNTLLEAVRRARAVVEGDPELLPA